MWKNLDSICRNSLCMSVNLTLLLTEEWASLPHNSTKCVWSVLHCYKTIQHSAEYIWKMPQGHWLISKALSTLGRVYIEDLSLIWWGQKTKKKSYSSAKQLMHNSSRCGSDFHPLVMLTLYPTICSLMYL